MKVMINLALFVFVLGVCINSLSPIFPGNYHTDPSLGTPIYLNNGFNSITGGFERVVLPSEQYKDNLSMAGIYYNSTWEYQVKAKIADMELGKSGTTGSDLNFMSAIGDYFGAAISIAPFIKDSLNAMPELMSKFNVNAVTRTLLSGVIYTIYLLGLISFMSNRQIDGGVF